MSARRVFRRRFCKLLILYVIGFVYLQSGNVTLYKNNFFVRAEIKLIGMFVDRCYGRDRKTNKNGYKWRHAQCFLIHGHLVILG